MSRQTGRDISALMFIEGDKYLQVLDGSRVTRTAWKPESFVESACARVSRKGLTCEEWDRYLKGEPYRPTCQTPTNRQVGCSAF